MSRRDIERHGYLKSFPNLLGCVSCLGGTEATVRRTVEDFYDGTGQWTAALETADLVLTPAACYPVYPIAAARGTVPAGGGASTSPAIASVANRRTTSTGSSRSGCGSTCASGNPMRSKGFGNVGSLGPPPSQTDSATLRGCPGE